MTLSPGNREAVLALLQLWLAVDRPKEGLEWAEKALSKHRRDVEVMDVAAQIYRYEICLHLHGMHPAVWLESHVLDSNTNFD